MPMHGGEKALHSILVVSPSASFDAVVKKWLPAERFMSIDFCKSAATARQLFFERYYDIVLISFPLPDETGAEFAFDIAQNCNASILIAAPVEIYDEVLERVSDYGILAISKRIRNRQLEKAVRLLCAFQEKMQQLEKELMTTHEKMEELRLISQAKCVLIEKQHMSEAQAHRFIGKEAMDHGLSRKRIAQRILEEYE